jgi:hypothetical protein
MGHSNSVTLRSDGEPALVDLLNKIAEKRLGIIVVEHSVRDSKANGIIERGVRSLEELVRLYIIDLERRIGREIVVSSNVFTWLVEHAADMYNKKLIASDGKTAYERLKGKKHHGVFAIFCKRVMFRVQGKDVGGVVTERWFEGIWLGKRFHTEEHIVADLKSGKVMRTRSIKQLPVETTWEDINMISGKPWAPRGGNAYRNESPKAVSKESEVIPEKFVFVPKAVKITEAVLQDYGYSDNCKRCEAMVKGKASYVGIVRISIVLQNCLRNFHRFRNKNKLLRNHLTLLRYRLRAFVPICITSSRRPRFP